MFRKVNIVIVTLVYAAASQFIQAQATTNCHVVITNPRLGNTEMSNLCLAFGDTATAQMLAGMCRPQWNGMNVNSQNLAVCPRATQGSCRHTVNVQNTDYQYTAHYYPTPLTTEAGNREMCIDGGGEWLGD